MAAPSTRVRPERGDGTRNWTDGIDGRYNIRPIAIIAWSISLRAATQEIDALGNRAII
jgi:hypothetical protein